MKSSNEKLNQAIRAFPLEHWLTQHTKVNTRSSSENVYADCPICKGKKTLGIHREKKIFHCFRCNEGGHGGSVWNGRASLLTFIKVVEGCSFWDAVNIVYRLAGYGSPVRYEEKQAPQSLLPEGCEKLGRCTRAWSEFVVPRDMMHLEGRLYLSSDPKYSGRVIFPCYFFGELIGFEAKTYTKQTPKSLFPEWMDTYSYFYTTDDSLKENFLIITESVVDAETLRSTSIGLYGSSLREGQLAKLVELKKKKGLEELFWMLDADAMKKQIKAILTKTKAHFVNYIVPLPDGEDPNSLGWDKCLDRVGEALYVKDDLDLLKIYANSLL